MDWFKKISKETQSNVILNKKEIIESFYKGQYNNNLNVKDRVV
jgi:hypothetical protein